MNCPWNHNPYSQQWTLDTQYAITPTLLLDVGYVGSHGLRLSTYLLYNTAYLPKVPADNCNYLFDISQATGSNASYATDPNFQPIDTRVPYPGLPSMMYANANVWDRITTLSRFSYGSATATASPTTLPTRGRSLWMISPVTTSLGTAVSSRTPTTLPATTTRQFQSAPSPDPHAKVVRLAIPKAS